jgi:3-oxoadipate enol-lactonase
LPFIDLPDHRIHYAVSGSKTAPVLILSNSLGTNFSMWDLQRPEFEKYFYVLRYDTRGHGDSAVSPGPYTFEQLGGDVVHLLDALKIERACFCGLSMGGMTGLWLGLHAPKRFSKLSFSKLIVASTSARFGNADSWNTRIATVRAQGMQGVAASVVERWFTPEFRAREPERVGATQEMLEMSPPEGYVACCAALRDSDMRESLASLNIPTLVISGASDPVSPPSEGRFLAESVPGAKYVELRGAHLVNIEAASGFTSSVVNFLTAGGA